MDGGGSAVEPNGESDGLGTVCIGLCKESSKLSTTLEPVSEESEDRRPGVVLAVGDAGNEGLAEAKALSGDGYNDVVE